MDGFVFYKFALPIRPLAFIGLSQVRETAVFGGIPIAERCLNERTCGVWVVNEDRELLAGSYELPEVTLAEVPEDLRK